MNIFGISLRNWFIIICINAVLCLSLYLLFKKKVRNSKDTKNIENNLYIKFVLIFIVGVEMMIIHYYFNNYNLLFFYIIIPSLILSGLLYAFTYKSVQDELWDVSFATNKGERILKGLKRGVAIFGSAGSGKTASIIYTILKHLGKKNFSGIIYDFKDGELTELAVPIFQERLRIVSIHRPSLSYRVNPINPDFIEGEKDVNEIVSVIMDNLTTGKDNDNFFKDSASSLLAGVILKFYFDHQKMCTLPHVISFILGLDFSLQEKIKGQSLGEQAENKFAKLKDFLTDNDRVALQASPFLMGLASERQTASVLSTLANSLRKMAYPEAYYVLSGNDLKLDVNSADNNTVICVMNEPKSARFLSPINACIIHSITKQMMVRNREPSFIILDEAPTIKLLNMAQIPATMRSFGVAVIYCAQDIVQGVVQYGRDGFKEIIANLSTQFFGKANDPDTSRYYEGYFEMIKEKTKSINRKGGDGNLFSWGENSITIGEKEVAKYRASVFTKLSVGEFAMLSDGLSDVVKFPNPKLETAELPIRNFIAKTELESQFNKIVNEVKTLINQTTGNQHYK